MKISGLQSLVQSGVKGVEKTKSCKIAKSEKNYNRDEIKIFKIMENPKMFKLSKYNLKKN